MKPKITILETDVINNQRINALHVLPKSPADFTGNSPVSEICAFEGCKNLYNYLEWLDLAKDPDLVVLSSMHHYYYDAEEMKNVKTVVNLKELNQIKEVKSFIHSIFHILPPKSYFVGYFVDNKKKNGYASGNKMIRGQSKDISEAIENGIASRIPFFNIIFNIMDNRTKRYLSRNNVTILLEGLGFKILDLTELFGTTYFCTQRLGSAN
jgi:hypothetical protein